MFPHRSEQARNCDSVEIFPAFLETRTLHHRNSSMSLSSVDMLFNGMGLDGRERDQRNRAETTKTRGGGEGIGQRRKEVERRG